MLVIQMLGNSFRPNQNRPGNAEDSRLQRGSREQHRKWASDSSDALHAAQDFNLSPFLQGHCMFRGSRNPAPTDTPKNEDCEESDQPESADHLRQLRQNRRGHGRYMVRRNSHAKLAERLSDFLDGEIDHRPDSGCVRGLG